MQDGDEVDDFSSTVERILAAAESRDGHLTPSDLTALSHLCQRQESRHSLNDGLGFADVDPSLTGQLVESLLKDVTTASSIDFVLAGYRAIQSGKEGFEKWSKEPTQRQRLLEKIIMGLEAASNLLFIINTPGIDRTVISEDAIEGCIVLARNHLSKNILPTINQVGHITSAQSQPQGTTRTHSTSAKKRRRSSAASSEEQVLVKDMRKVYPPLYRSIGPMVQILERLEVLVQKVPLDDQPLLNLSTGALFALELEPHLQTDIPKVYQINEAAIGVISAIFRKYPRHRQIMIEDLFPVMLKLPTHKRSMRNMPIRSSSILYPSGIRSLAHSLAKDVEPGYIQTISALILSLVQCSVVRPQVTVAQEENSQAQEMEQIQTLEISSGLKNCQAVSDMFVAHLLNRCSRKAEDGGASEFRPILANLIDDLLMVLLVPEYPAAEMLLMSLANGISRELLQICNSSRVAESTYISTILDTFGKICAAEAKILKLQRDSPVRMQSTARPANDNHLNCYCGKEGVRIPSITCVRCNDKYHSTCIALAGVSMPDDWYCDACQLGRIVGFERERNSNLGDLGCSPELVDESYCMRRLLVDYLSIMTVKSGFTGLQDAYEFHLARWIFEVNQPQNKHGSATSAQTHNISPLVTRLVELWDPQESSDYSPLGGKSLHGMLHCLSDEGRCRIMVHVATTQSQLFTSYRSQIGLFVNQLIGNKKNSAIRKLALKAIEKVTDADPKLMIYPFVRNAVTQRFSDDAISVREAAVSLVGLYVVHSPAVANAFHKAFMVGLQDDGVSVRKRTIKILQDILCSNPSYKGRAEACTIMLRLAADPKEDDSVRDTIHDLFLKVWLENGEENVTNEISPATPEIDQKLYSPGGRVLDAEFVNAAGDVVSITPSTGPTDSFAQTPRETRSTERRVKKRRLQLRSEIAAEQMVEVVKAADTGEHLTTLFRDLLDGETDADKGRTTSSRRKKKQLEEGHCALIVDALFEILLRNEEQRSEQEGTTAEDVVAVIRTIGVFADISPGDVHRHLDTLLPYLKGDNGMRFAQESVVAASLCDATATVAHVLTKDELEALGETMLANDLVKITHKFGREAISSAIRALCSLAYHKHCSETSPFKVKLLQLAKTFYGYLLKHRNEENFSAMKEKAKNNIQRALSVLGAICRYHEVGKDDEDLRTGDEEEISDEDFTAADLTFANLTATFERLFAIFLSKNDDHVKCAALRGLCGVFIARPRELLRMDQSGLVSQVMAPDSPSNLQLESLVCWRDILLTEEARIESGDAKKKMDAKANITISKKISGDQDADATLFGGILTSHAVRLLQLTQVRDKNLRFAALDLVGHLLRQGQINPNETVPYLLALQGDVEEDGIRSLALKLLLIEGDKRPDMLRQRVYAGIRQAYAFQNHVYPSKGNVSALVKIRTGGTFQIECVFSKVFKESIASNRKQRRGLFSSLLRRFDLQSRRKNADIGGGNDDITAEDKLVEALPLLSFTSQVLAYLPYRVASDPLFVIYNINALLALRGPDVLDRLAAFLRPYGLCSADEMDEVNYEEDYLEVAAKMEFPHTAQEGNRMLDDDFALKKFSFLCAEAAALTLLLRLKSFLKSAYDLNESRILGFNPDAKDQFEKAMSKAPSLSFSSNLSIGLLSGQDEKTTVDKLIAEYAEFRKLMREETNASEAMELDDGDDESMAGQKRRLSVTEDVTTSEVEVVTVSA